MLKRNLLWNYACQLWSALANLLFVPWYLHFLGVEAYGVIGLFASIQIWFTLLDMGITPALARELAAFGGGTKPLDHIWTLLRTTEYLFLVMGVCLFGIGYLAAPWVANKWLQATSIPPIELEQAVKIVIFTSSLRFCENIYRSCLVGLQLQHLLNIINIIIITLKTAGAAAVLSLFSPSLHAFFGWQALVAIVSLASLWFTTYSALPTPKETPRWNPLVMKGISNFAGGVAIISCLSMILTQIDKILLSRLLPLKEFGYYTIAAAVAASLYSLVSPITQAWYPRFCMLWTQSRSDELADSFHNAAQLVSVIHGSAAIFLIVYSDHLTYLWLGSRGSAEAIAPLLSVLALANLIHGMVWIPYQLQLSAGWTRLAINLNVAAIFLLVPTFLLAVPHTGRFGAAWLLVALNLFYFTVGGPYMFTKLLKDERRKWITQDLLHPLLASLATAMTLRHLVLIESSKILHISLLALSGVLVLSSAVLAAPRVRALVLKRVTTPSDRH
jgi:O-antigen/teichoic acid export membrane protein